MRFQFSASSVMLTSLALLIGFIVFRVVNGVYMLVTLIRIGPKNVYDSAPLPGVTSWIIVVFLLVLNSYWTSLMLRKAFQKCGTRRRGDSDTDVTLLEAAETKN